jgi:hypothetical protein
VVAHPAFLLIIVRGLTPCTHKKHECLFFLSRVVGSGGGSPCFFAHHCERSDSLYAQKARVPVFLIQGCWQWWPTLLFLLIIVRGLTPCTHKKHECLFFLSRVVGSGGSPPCFFAHHCEGSDCLYARKARVPVFLIQGCRMYTYTVLPAPRVEHADTPI